MPELRTRRRLLLEFDGDASLAAFMRELRDAEVIDRSVQLQRRPGERAQGLAFADGSRVVFVPPSNVVPFPRKAVHRG